VEGKFFARKKCDDWDKDTCDDLKKIQLIKDPELPFFIIIKGNTITDIPDPVQELGDLVSDSLK